MGTDASRVQMVSGLSGRAQCWVESLILALGGPSGLWFALQSRGLSFRDLGVWGLGTWPAWVVALLLAALSIGGNLRFLPRMHIPISYAFLPHGIHLFAALAMGITAGFCEEVL